ncbi:MAG TPA: hypothetical protein VJ870_15215 [Amycolatopsis sp.]|nr:hypothetical protein [Amycolatopsis sp.]
MLTVAAGGRLTDRLTAWDGQWYLRIAATGYDLDPVPDAHGHLNPFTPRAFFPGYPVLIRWTDAVTGVGGTTSALLVAGISGLFAAYGLARLGRLVRGGSPRAGYLLVALFAAAPMGVALSMAYTEALFCALAVWALVGVLERRFVLAGVCCAAAGLVRSSALALAIAVGLAALAYVPRERRRAAAAVVLAPLGLVGYLWWTGLRVRPDTGFVERLGTWADLEWQGWSTKFDGGVATARFLWQGLHSGDAMTVLTVAVILGYLVLLAVAVRQRLEWPLLVYAAGVLVMSLESSGLMHAKPRLLLPAFTLLVSVAIGLANRRRSTAVLTVAGAALVSAWFDAYALTVWKYAI